MRISLNSIVLTMWTARQCQQLISIWSLLITDWLALSLTIYIEPGCCKQAHLSLYREVLPTTQHPPITLFLSLRSFSVRPFLLSLFSLSSLWRPPGPLTAPPSPQSNGGESLLGDRSWSGSLYGSRLEVIEIILEQSQTRLELSGHPGRLTAILEMR